MLEHSKKPRILIVGIEDLVLTAVSEFHSLGYDILIFIPRENKAMAQRLGLDQLGHEVFLFDDLESQNAHEKAQEFQPETILCVIFETRIPQSFCDIASKCALNFHPAALPECRSGNAWFWPIRSGATQGAISIHHMEYKWDAGAVVVKHPFPLGPFDTQGIYTERVYRQARQSLQALHTRLLSGEFDGEPQPKSSYYPKIALRDLAIDWNTPAKEIDALVRACNPFHYAEAVFRGQVIQIIQVSITPMKRSELTDASGQAIAPGQLVIRNHQLFCAAQHTALRLDIVGVRDKITTTGDRFAHLFQVRPGEALTSILVHPRYQTHLDTLL